MSLQSEALLGLVLGWDEIPRDRRTHLEGMLWREPIRCTPEVFAEAQRDADERDGKILAKLRDRGFVVVTERPEEPVVRKLVGFENRATRRAQKPGKTK